MQSTEYEYYEYSEYSDYDIAYEDVLSDDCNCTFVSGGESFAFNSNDSSRGGDVVWNKAEDLCTCSHAVVYEVIEEIVETEVIITGKDKIKKATVYNVCSVFRLLVGGLKLVCDGLSKYTAELADLELPIPKDNLAIHTFEDDGSLLYDIWTVVRTGLDVITLPGPLLLLGLIQ